MDLEVPLVCLLLVDMESVSFKVRCVDNSADVLRRQRLRTYHSGINLETAFLKLMVGA